MNRIIITTIKYTKTPKYSWTIENEEGGCFGMSNFSTFSAALLSARRSLSDLPVFEKVITWDYEKNAAIETLVPYTSSL